MVDPLQNYAEILGAHQHLRKLMYEHWRQYELFTYQWWLLLGMLILPWIIWWKLVDKTRTIQIFCYGLFMMFMIIAMDTIGIAQEAWIYPIKIVPAFAYAGPIDWSMLPVLHMLIYQYFSKWKSFLVAEVIVCALLAFVGESFAEWLGIYSVLHWEHIWSFPIYLIKAVLGKWFIESLSSRN